MQTQAEKRSRLGVLEQLEGSREGFDAGAVAALRVRIDCWPDVRFADLPLESLRFYLNGEPALVHTLYELLCNNCTSIVLRDPRPKFRQRPIELVADALKAVGFGDDEALLPYSDRGLSG